MSCPSSGLWGILPMTQTSMQLTINPFATRYVAPGRLDWCESDQGELCKLSQRFAELGSRSQIIGPHGSGKTTLLHHLVGKLSFPANIKSECSSLHSNPDDGIVWLTLRRGMTCRRFLNQQLQNLNKGDLLILDGFEQLSWCQQRWVRVATRLRQCRLLVTCHRSVGLPTLRKMQVTAELAKTIVLRAQLEAAGNHWLPDSIVHMDYQKLLTKHAGSMRECLMELYDIVEASQENRRAGSALSQPGDDQ